MIQATGWNSLERTASDWQKVFTSISDEYHFLCTRTPKSSAVSLIEARFEIRRVEEVAGGLPNRSQVTNDTAVPAS